MIRRYLLALCFCFVGCAKKPVTADGNIADKTCIPPDASTIPPLNIPAMVAASKQIDKDEPFIASIDAYSYVPSYQCEAVDDEGSKTKCLGNVAKIDENGEFGPYTTLSEIQGGVIEEIFFENAFVADVNGDGQNEVGFPFSFSVYTTDGIETSYQHLALVDYKNQTVIWEGVLRQEGPANNPELCESNILLYDRDCDGLKDLSVVTKCGPPACMKEPKSCDADAIKTTLKNRPWSR